MTFNGIEYKLKENNLAINQASIPLLIKYRKLQAEYLDDIDLSPVLFYDNKINEYEIIIRQLKELSAEDVYIDNITNGEKLIEIEEKLKELKELKENDEEVNIILKMRNDIEALILTEISLDTDLMFKLFSKILIGDTSKIDYEHPDYQMFAMEVLAGFFTLMQLNKNGLLN